MTSKNLLVELFVEELPPKALKKLGESFAASLSDSLKAQGLSAASATVSSFASPRRLAVHMTDVASAAADKPVSQKLMPVSVGLGADGQPTPALLKKLAAVGVAASAVPSLKRQMDGKAEALFFDSLVKGATLAEGLQKAVEEALAKLPIPKVMQYQLEDGWTSVNFVRPAHGLVALHGADVVPVSALGLRAGRTTQGHRFEAAKAVVELRDADHYAKQLLDEGAVIASFAGRRADIVRQLDAAAAKQGLKPIADEALLDEVAALVERPNVLLCRFESEFLDVPQECLILTMKANQKYFPLLDAKGKLTNQFLIVSNIRPQDPSRVVEGNERVVRPRLADAKFFFDQDRKKTLESRVASLAKVVYHNKLGTQGERVERVRTIAKAIGQQLGGESLAAQADQAAKLAKADLLTDMVGEFPELQGIMGGYYARHDGLSEEIAAAIEDHYKPRFAGDELPRNSVGEVVALADKIETLVGLFGIGQAPTGDKDPFALRRHTLGIIRILVERQLPLSIDELVLQTEETFGGLIELPREVLLSFIEERAKYSFTLESFYNDQLAQMGREHSSCAWGDASGRLYTPQEADAVMALKPKFLCDVPRRLMAVRTFSLMFEAASLAAANKRVGNILRRVEGVVEAKVSAELLKEPDEIALAYALNTVKAEANAAFDRGDYTASLQALAALKTPVDAFFDNVMVNVDDPTLRANRLGLLAQLHATMNRVADLSKLAT